MTSASLMHEAGYSKPVLWKNPEGWSGDGGGGTYVHAWLTHVNVRPKPPQYCKAISLQLK